MRDLPSGFRFHPIDQELVLDYLYKKVYNEPLPSDVILDEDVYRAEPWHLGRVFPYGMGSEVYYFTLATRSSTRNHRKVRTAGNGVWRMNGQTKKIMGEDGEVVGYKTALKYFTLGPSNKKVGTPWIMHEYRLHYKQDFLDNKEMVLYRIQETGRSAVAHEDSNVDVDERPRKKIQIQERLHSAAESNNHQSHVVPPHAIGSDRRMAPWQTSTSGSEIFISSAAGPSNNEVVLSDDGMFPSVQVHAVAPITLPSSSGGQFSANHGLEAHRPPQHTYYPQRERVQQFHAIGDDHRMVPWHPSTFGSESFISSTAGPSNNEAMLPDDGMIPSSSDGIIERTPIVQVQALSPITLPSFSQGQFSSNHGRELTTCEISGLDIFSSSIDGPSDYGSDIFSSFIDEPSDYGSETHAKVTAVESCAQGQLPTDDHHNKGVHELQQLADELKDLFSGVSREWLPHPALDWVLEFPKNAALDP